MSSHQVVPLSPRHRSAVTSRSRVLVGVDGRSALARRYRDLVAALSDELGGEFAAAEHLQLRNAATLQLHAEEMTARLVRGEDVDPEAITRAANGATRALAALRRRRGGQKPSRASVADYLSKREGRT